MYASGDLAAALQLDNLDTPEVMLEYVMDDWCPFSEWIRKNRRGFVAHRHLLPEAPGVDSRRIAKIIGAGIRAVAEKGVSAPLIDRLAQFDWNLPLGQHRLVMVEHGTFSCEGDFIFLEIYVRVTRRHTLSNLYGLLSGGALQTSFSVASGVLSIGK